MQAELPELLILGEYDPDKKAGPAIWLRCVIAGKMEALSLPKNLVPIFYLPGVSRQDLRAIENCPDHLKPLAELQYRGTIWSQINAKDWTILAFLKSDQGGLGLDVAQDNDAKKAIQWALYQLLDEDVELLKGKRLDHDYFNTLLTGGDRIRDLLQWLDQGDTFQTQRGENEWKAFVAVCKSQLAFDPQNDAVIRALACVESTADFEAISTAIRSIYLPWVEESARHLQKSIDETSYQGRSCLSVKPLTVVSSECILFVDGLRFDACKRLAEMLERSGFDITEEPA